jgi:hypothetical protein
LTFAAGKITGESKSIHGIGRKVGSPVKRIALIALGLTTTFGVCAQGTLNFANIGGGGLNSPFYDVDGTTRLNGQYNVELLAGQQVGSLSSIVVVTTTFVNGYFNGGAQTINNITGISGFALVRMWSLEMFPPEPPRSTIIGVSGYESAGLMGVPFPITVTPLSIPPATPAWMNSMPSITLISVPEPSTLALAMLGSAAVLFLRRRK